MYTSLVQPDHKPELRSQDSGWLCEARCKQPKYIELLIGSVQHSSILYKLEHKAIKKLCISHCHYPFDGRMMTAARNGSATKPCMKM